MAGRRLSFSPEPATNAVMRSSSVWASSQRGPGLGTAELVARISEDRIRKCINSVSMGFGLVLKDWHYIVLPCLLMPFLLRWASAAQTQNKAKRLLPNYPPKHELFLKCQSRRVLLKSTKGRKREEERLANHPAPLLVRVGTSGRRTEIPHRARRRFTELPANGFSLIHCFSLSCPERMTEFIATGNISPCFAVVSEHAVILHKHGSSTSLGRERAASVSSCQR